MRRLFLPLFILEKWIPWQMSLCNKCTSIVNNEMYHQWSGILDEITHINSKIIMHFVFTKQNSIGYFNSEDCT